MPRLAVHLLGPPRVELDGEPVHISRRKSLALLAYLALSNAPQSRDALATLLWPGYDQRAARAHLRRALASLTKRLGGEWFDAGRETLGLHPDAAIVLDVNQFRGHLAACGTHIHPVGKVPPDCLPHLEDAVALYRDDFMAGFTLRDSLPFDDWQRSQSEELRRELASALERLVRGLSAQGQHEAALPYARLWLELDPAHEAVHRHLMMLYARAGQVSAALRQYRLCERTLTDDLGVEPGPATQALYKKIREGELRQIGAEPAPAEVAHTDEVPRDAPVETTAHLERVHTQGSALPTGTITFLFTDIEGSTPVWEREPAAMGAAIARHHAILHAAAEAHHGHVFKIVGDEFQISFAYPSQALGAALDAQRALRGETWGATGPLKVRMGLHTGPGNLGDGIRNTDDYAVSHTLNRVARIRSAGHGGQVLLSLATAELLGDGLPQDTSLRDLGEHTLKGLARPERIFQIVAPDLPADFPPLVSQSRLRHNLPAQPTPFVGREAELVELNGLLADPDVRLLTILGAGGMGKTRLALQAGAAQLERFQHGVYFVSLAALRSADVIAPTVAEALGLTFYAAPGGGGQMEPRQQLLDYLRHKRMLIILDNFEHLLDDVGLVSDILQTAPGVKLLATSRARLNVGGEQRFHLAGMDFPDWEMPDDAAEYSAVQLFLQSARRARPGFALDADDLKYVSRICRLVGGMPLGIRLAAAWVELLTPREIAAEIGQGLDLLETELSDVPARQQSVRAVFDYTWNLLSEQEREVFMGLSVFRGGFTREAVQQVTGASLRELMALADKSLLQRAPTGRYEVHELPRGYAEEKLDQDRAAGDMARDRHSAYYAAALQGWEAELKGLRQRAALAELDAEIENARAAWEWATERGQVERLDRALEGLCLYYFRRARFLEGEAACRVAASTLVEMDWSEAAERGRELTAPGALSVEVPVTSPSTPRGMNPAAEPQASGRQAKALRVWAKVLAWQGFFNYWLGHSEQSRQQLKQSLDLLEGTALAAQDTRAEKAFVLLAMGWAMHLYDYERATWLFEQSLALYRALGDRWWTAYVLRYLGSSSHLLGCYGEARKWGEESLAIRQSLGDLTGIADSFLELGITSRAQGQLEEAERFYRDGLAIGRDMDDRAGRAWGFLRLGEVLVQLGKIAEGCSSLAESQAIYDDLGLRWYLAAANSFLGEAQSHLGQYEQARVLGWRGLAVFQEIDMKWGIAFTHYVVGMVAVAVEAYAEAHQLLQNSLSAFREVGHRENLGYALAVMGYAARGLGQLPQARQHLYEALQMAADIGAFTPFVLALPAVALLFADQGDALSAERAVELYGLASRYPYVANSRWFEDVAGKPIAAAAADLPPDVVAAAQERGRARDLWETAGALLDELDW